MSVEIGQTAPNFCLKGHDDKEYKLSTFKGKKNVLMVFYPLAFTPV